MSKDNVDTYVGVKYYKFIVAHNDTVVREVYFKVGYYSITPGENDVRVITIAFNTSSNPEFDCETIDFDELQDLLPIEDINEPNSNGTEFEMARARFMGMVKSM